MNLEAIANTYDRYSKIYDVLFHIFFSTGRKDAIVDMSFSEDSHILEVGIGTGASLPLYPKGVRVTGIDLSEKMLGVCSDRIEEMELENVQLHIMDAENLQFKENTFSKVSAMYIVSVSPSPKRLMSELIRVCKHDGEIVIVNHFSHNCSLMSGIEKRLNIFSLKMGFRSYFPLEAFLEELPSCLTVNEVRRTGLFGYWTLIRLSKSSPI